MELQNKFVRGLLSCCLFPCSLALLLSNAAPALGAASAISPSGNTIPENLLRIELRLDRPLVGPLDMHHVTLLDASGAPIKDALLDMALSSRDRSRMSILLHPGRIKTGVGPNVSLGPALHQGAKLTLLIDDPQLPGPVRKSWTVGAPVSERIDVKKWAIEVPASATRKTLRITFPNALDAGAAGLIAVAAADGSRVIGRATLLNGERQWQFLPASPWRTGNYQVRVHPDIEDPQGNRMCSAFEQQLQSSEACHDDGIVNFSVRQ